jgi:hypothetical protein
MIRKLGFLFTVGLLLTACTKEVPERERKASKSEEEISVRKVIDNYYLAYNNGDVETASDLIDAGYRGIVSDSIDVNGIEETKEDLLKYSRQYPKGQWEAKIEEVTMGENFAIVLCTSSFLMPDPVEKKPTPIYSERSMRILKKDKVKGWKIFRYLATPTFTYDDN